MSRRISQTITPTADDVKVLREPFANKGANDPVVAMVRQLLRDPIPDWLGKLDETQELTVTRLDELQVAIGAHRKLIEAVLPEGDVREDSLARLSAAETIVSEMSSELSGIAAFSGTSA